MRCSRRWTPRRAGERSRDLGRAAAAWDCLLEATTDGACIRRWWGRWPRANVTIPTRERSGFLVLDGDAGEGTDSMALLELSRGQPRRPRAPRQVGEGRICTSATLPDKSYGRRACTRSRRGTARGFSGTAWTCASRAATSWSRPAARHAPTGGWNGCLPPAPPGCSAA
jgi:hypothetical protein